MPRVGASICTFPAFSLVSTNAMVDLHGRPHLFPSVAVYPGAFYIIYLPTPTACPPPIHPET